MPPDYDIAFEDQVRECFGRAVYTHKTHERMKAISVAQCGEVKPYRPQQLSDPTPVSPGT